MSSSGSLSYSISSGATAADRYHWWDMLPALATNEEHGKRAHTPKFSCTLRGIHRRVQTSRIAWANGLGASCGGLCPIFANNLRS
jgi:hypothetical protein